MTAKRRTRQVILAGFLVVALLGAGQRAFHPRPVHAQEMPGVSGTGVLLDIAGRPAVGAVVQITNTPPDGRFFRFFADANGAFQLSNLPLTPTVNLLVSWDPFHKVVDVDIPRERLEGEGRKFLLQSASMDLTGKVVLAEGGQDQPVPDARIIAVRDTGETPLGTTDAAGQFQLPGVSLETLGSPAQGKVRVELPAALTLARHFDPGPQVTLDVDIANGVSDLGTVRFHPVSNPAAMVHLAGSLTALDSLDVNASRPIEGMVIRAISPESGQVVAQTATQAGHWSLTLPQGSYALDAPNAPDLGFAALPADMLRIEFDRDDLDNGLLRPAPQLSTLEPQRLTFTYPETPGLPVQQVVVRMNGAVAADMVSSVQRDASHFTVSLARPLSSTDRVEIAVRLDGLLSRFSAAQALTEGAP